MLVIQWQCVISQGHDLETARIIAFWSGKFNSAQQNYPVHEQELLAIVESLKRFRNLLHGAQFHIFTDHKALEFLQTNEISLHVKLDGWKH